MGQPLYSHLLSQRRKVQRSEQHYYPSNLPNPAIDQLFAGWVERVLLSQRGRLHSDLVEELEQWLSEVLSSGRGIPTARHPHGAVLSENLEVSLVLLVALPHITHADYFLY